MGTAVSDVILNYGMVAINDERLYREQAENPARFLRKMSLWLQSAVPRFNRPPEAQSWLRYTPPRYADYLFCVEGPLEAPVSIETGLTGYELCTLTLRRSCGGRLETQRFDQFTYDPATGLVVIRDDLDGVRAVDIDLYADGEFEKPLTPEMLRILGMCLQVVWEGRFAGDYLLMTPKLSDRNFSTKGTEANETRANTERLRFLEQSLDSELRSFEQSLSYRQTVSQTAQYSFPSY